MIKWYPPAETRIPLMAFATAFQKNQLNAEKSILEETNSTYCLFGPSGRSLLYHLLVKLAKIGKGKRNEVLIPAYTCYSVAASIVKAGLKLRFYDLEPRTFSPIIPSVEENCSEHTLAIVSQHLLGIPSDSNTIEKIAKNMGAYHIEDAAQAFGGRRDATSAGATGDFGLFSFGRGKSLPLGGGGALISKRYALSELIPPISAKAGIKKLVINGLTQIAANPIFYGLAEKLPLGLGKTEFDPDFRLDDLPSSILNLMPAAIDKLHEMTEHRRKVAEIYSNGLPANKLISIDKTSEPVYTRFPVLAKPGKLQNDLHQLGVRRLYPDALHCDSKICIYAVNMKQQLTGAEIIARNLITLPTHSAISYQLAERIAVKVKTWLNT